MTVCLATDLVCFALLLRQSHLLKVAGLICDNSIVTVPAALVSTSTSQMKQDVDETIVSTLGVLLGNRMYRWGQDGVRGVRLLAVELSQEWMHLTFGDKAETMYVDLLHGLTKREEILAVTSKLLFKTGVEADVSGW